MVDASPVLEALVDHPCLVHPVAVHLETVAYPGRWVVLVGVLAPGDLVGEPLGAGPCLPLERQALVEEDPFQAEEASCSVGNPAQAVPLLEDPALVEDVDSCSAVDPVRAYSLREGRDLQEVEGLFQEEEGPCLVVDLVLVGCLPEDLLWVEEEVDPCLEEEDPCLAVDPARVCRPLDQVLVEAEDPCSRVDPALVRAPPEC